MGLTRIFLRIQRIRISEKLGLYDNENVRVLVFDIDWVFV